MGWVSAFRRDKLVLVGTHPRPGSGTYAFTTSHMDGTGDAQQLGGLVGAHVATVGADSSHFARVYRHSEHGLAVQTAPALEGEEAPLFHYIIIGNRGGPPTAPTVHVEYVWRMFGALAWTPVDPGEDVGERWLGPLPSASPGSKRRPAAAQRSLPRNNNRQGAFAVGSSAIRVTLSVSLFLVIWAGACMLVGGSLTLPTSGAMQHAMLPSTEGSERRAGAAFFAFHCGRAGRRRRRVGGARR